MINPFDIIDARLSNIENMLLDLTCPRPTPITKAKKKNVLPINQYILCIEDMEANEIIEVNSPLTPLIGQTITYYGKNLKIKNRVVWFIDFKFDKKGNYKYAKVTVRAQKIDYDKLAKMIADKM